MSENEIITRKQFLIDTYEIREGLFDYIKANYGKHCGVLANEQHLVNFLVESFKELHIVLEEVAAMDPKTAKEEQQ